MRNQRIFRKTNLRSRDPRESSEILEKNESDLQESSENLRNLRENREVSSRILKNLRENNKESSGILRNPQESSRIIREFFRILRNLQEFSGIQKGAPFGTWKFIARIGKS